ncbi:MAG: Succinylornithine transaminase/acetylornithine aminotransferase [Verrucomicrobiota bacterium]
MTLSTTKLYRNYVMPTYGRFDIALARGEGSSVWDEEGKEYLDFGAGIAVCSLGHSHPKLSKAVAEQAARLVHTSNLYLTRPQGELAKLVVDLVGLGGKVFFCNSGAEANEGLYKLARKFGAPTGRHEIITFTNSFHGRTLGGISATGQEKVKAGFAPLVEGFVHVHFNDLAAVEAAITPKTAAILLEPVQGEGGINPATPEFLKGVRALCDRHNLLLMFDEVQCGFGRTGDWCAWRTIVPQGVEPDAVSWAKGIANGFPLGAFWAGTRSAGSDADGKERGPLCDLLGPGTHGTTYGGNPLASTAGLTVLKAIGEEGLLKNARELGNHLMRSLEAMKLPAIRLVRGVGLMIGIELNDLPTSFGGEGLPSIRATKDLMKSGLLVIPSGERTIRLIPPLNITKAEADKALAILKKVLSGGS